MDRGGSTEARSAPAATVSAIACALTGSVERALAGTERPVVLFSGGLDSGLLAWTARTHRGLSLRTVGLPGARDLAWAVRAAELLGLPWSGVEVPEVRLRGRFTALEPALQQEPEPTRSVHLALELALDSIQPGVALIGQGADELFGGYAHFRALSPAEARRRASADLERLILFDWPRTLRVAARAGVELKAPYLDPGLRSLVDSVPDELRFASGEAKGLLRQVARAVGLPGPLAERPKLALQYGSGVARSVRALARPSRT